MSNFRGGRRIIIGETMRTPQAALRRRARVSVGVRVVGEEGAGGFEDIFIGRRMGQWEVCEDQWRN